MIAIDQYGQRYRLRSKHPRKELLEMFGRQHASKMYLDTADGTKHIGYVIAGMWLEIFEPWRKPV